MLLLTFKLITDFTAIAVNTETDAIEEFMFLAVYRNGRKRLDKIIDYRRLAYVFYADIPCKIVGKKNGITEELKATDQMRGVQEMNNIRACAEEFVLREVVYQ